MQAPRLGRGSLGSIIARGEIPDPPKLSAALRLSGATEVVSRLDAGLETFVEDNDLRIGTSARQRLALARAFYDFPALVVLDEPTTHLDDRGERDVVAAVSALKKSGISGRSVIISRLAAFTALADVGLLVMGGEVRDVKSGHELKSFLSSQSSPAAAALAMTAE